MPTEYHDEMLKVLGFGSSDCSPFWADELCRRLYEAGYHK